ncbi:carbohydrate-binding module family 13 protein [Mycena vitilis]|nr:carbohydrate-binding module family 13 protein [Mycena vitilis]
MPAFSSIAAAASPQTATPVLKEYIHPNANSEKCLTAASDANGAVVKIEDCISAGSSSQSWTVSESSVQIFGNKCLDVTGSAITTGTKMQVWTCTGGPSQKWEHSGSTIQWSGSSSCLDLTGGSAENGNVMQIWTCNGDLNQEWTRTTATDGDH